MAGDQQLAAAVLIALDEPRLVEQGAHGRPVAVSDQQVVALRQHERHLAWHRDGAGDGLLDLTVELGRIDDGVLAGAQAPQQRDVARRVECVGSPLAVGAAEPLELGLGEVEAVHADQAGGVRAELERLGRADRKGAPDTFDAAGYVALLRRLRAREDAVVYAPEFHREIEQPVACAVPVPRETPLVVTEGNYLLVADGDWAGVRALLDEAWFVEGDEDRRRELLIARHVAFGKSPAYAREWVLRSDERNAELVASARPRAELVVRID